jgi:N6-adenosine-specific RNA methylase IME4
MAGGTLLQTDIEPLVDPEFSAAIPPLSSEERSQLEANIIRDGCRDPLVVWNGILLDGHNRYEICSRRGIEFRVVEVNLPDRDAAADWIDANQLGRRNLHPDQFTLLLGRRYNRAKKQGERTDTTSRQSGEKSPAESLAKQHNVGARTVERAGQFARAVDKLKTADPEIERKVVAAGPSAPPRQAVVKAAQLLDRAPEKAKAILSGDTTAREVFREERRAERVEKLAEVSRGNTPLVDAAPIAFPILYVDPPWRYEHVETESRAIENHYPTMSHDDLCALPVNQAATDDAVMFMWATSPKLAEAMHLLDAWGFTYRTCMVWVKDKIGMGYYARQQHELLLIAVKGNPPTPAPSDRPASVVNAPRNEHSAKPDVFAALIERMYPTLPKLEMFCRSPRDGWHVWGNQA